MAGKPGYHSPKKKAGNENIIQLNNNSKGFNHQERKALLHELALRCDISFLSNVCSRNFGLTRWREPSSPVASLRTFIDKSFTMWQILIKASSTRRTSSEDGNLTILWQNTSSELRFSLPLFTHSQEFYLGEFVPESAHLSWDRSHDKDGISWNT